MPPCVLIIDDDPDYGLDLASLLAPDFSCRFAASGEEGLGSLASDPPDAVILDLLLGSGRDGLEILAGIRQILPTLPVIMATAHPSAETEAEALRRGALYYVPKAAGRGEILAKLEKCIEVSRADRERNQLRVEIHALQGTLLCSSPAMKAMEATIDRIAVAPSSTVLITGESGTGKSHVAREIHRRGPRASGPFLRVNMATLGEDVLRSELFGHVKGAFTGAVSDRKGHFEAAAGGVIFLDEIGDLPRGVQGHLLHAIEEREILPVGSSTPRPVTARVIAATNRDLVQLIAAGQFREDLHGRLSVLTLRVPPLREHPEDIPDLARYFLGRFAAEMRLGRVRLADEALQKLWAYSWKRNNVRELRNAIERALVLCGHEGVLTPAAFDLPGDDSPASFDYKLEKALVVRDFQLRFFERAFQAIGGSMARPHPEEHGRIAELTGIPAHTVRRILKELG